MSVWAVHIELEESLDTYSFIYAMLRFINQGGLPSLLVSDFGTNFKGAVNEIKTETLKLDHSKVGNKMTQKKIQRLCSIHPFHHTWEGYRKEWFKQSKKLCLLSLKIIKIYIAERTN